MRFCVSLRFSFCPIPNRKPEANDERSLATCRRVREVELQATTALQRQRVPTESEDLRESGSGAAAERAKPAQKPGKQWAQGKGKTLKESTEKHLVCPSNVLVLR